MTAEELDDLLLAARELGRAVLYHPPRDANGDAEKDAYRTAIALLSSAS